MAANGLRLLLASVVLRGGVTGPTTSGGAVPVAVWLSCGDLAGGDAGVGVAPDAPDALPEAALSADPELPEDAVVCPALAEAVPPVSLFTSLPAAFTSPPAGLVDSFSESACPGLVCWAGGTGLPTVPLFVL